MAFPRSGTVDTQTMSGTKDFVFARASVTQNANIGVGDHLKFDTVDASRGFGVSAAGAASNGAVALDTTTAYSNVVGAPSLGRFSLQGGKLYKLECSPGYVLLTAAGSLVTLQWFDVTTLGAAVAIGQPLMILPLPDAGFENSTGDLWTMYNPGGSSQDKFLVEVQITAVTTLISIGAALKGFPTVCVETY